MRKNVAIALLALAVIALVDYAHQLRQVRNDLIDLNHDKSEYIDGGCKGRFQGSEEMLSHE